MAQPASASTPQDGSAADPHRTNEDLNLKVVRRYNGAVRRIMSLAPYAVIYNFDTASAAWEKSGVEGTLFVCELQPGPLGEARYTVFVLNRRGFENFECRLAQADNVELTAEYVILQVEAPPAGGR
ncbi:hypothetical protein KEM52_004146 [Ascosphaera acerosa]|nr:hypothetical protein KEM52_004146 [Ascosphaera acerosa]